MAGTREGAAEGGYAREDGEGRGRAESPGDPILGYAEPGTDSVGGGDRGAKSMDALRSSLDPMFRDISLNEAPDRGRFGNGRSSCSHRSAGRFNALGGDAVSEDAPGYEVDGCANGYPACMRRAVS